MNTTLAEKIKFPPQDLSRCTILKGKWTTFNVKLTITNILYLTNAPVQENEVLSFV